NALPHKLVVQGTAGVVQLKSDAHGKGGPARMWKALTYFLALSSVGLSMLHVFLNWHHRKHESPEFISHPNLHISSKPFPWRDGNHTLYHNSHVNPCPTAHEDE
uniref:Cytochrome c oxidase polypeptide VIa n=1 Tax=Ursus americanus TaxID=9643 RepID=A0A452S7Y0_URSAM